MTGVAAKCAVVIGYGSIGARHAKVLEALGLLVAVVSRRALDRPNSHLALGEALAERPDYVVVANETSRHGATLAALADAGWSGVTLVEKPLVAKRSELPSRIPDHCYVGYNMRFLPLLRRLREELAGERILTIEARVGYWLPHWRPGRDYRKTSSASRAEGGGVLADLSHEMDYLLWLAGPWRRVCALGGKVSDLELDVEDAAVMLVETERCPVASVSLNYLDRTEDRRVIVNTANGTLVADFIAGTLSIDGRAERVGGGDDIDASYAAMHRDILSSAPRSACGAAAALDVAALIEAAARSISERRWALREEMA